MPLLTPNKNESRNDFVSRFISDSNMEKDYPDMKQRLAIAFEQWKRSD